MNKIKRLSFKGRTFVFSKFISKEKYDQLKQHPQFNTHFKFKKCNLDRYAFYIATKSGG